MMFVQIRIVPERVKVNIKHETASSVRFVRGPKKLDNGIGLLLSSSGAKGGRETILPFFSTEAHDENCRSDVTGTAALAGEWFSYILSSRERGRS